MANLFSCFLADGNKIRKIGFFTISMKWTASILFGLVKWKKKNHNPFILLLSCEMKLIKCVANEWILSPPRRSGIRKHNSGILWIHSITPTRRYKCPRSERMNIWLTFLEIAARSTEFFCPSKSNKYLLVFPFLPPRAWQNPIVNNRCKFDELIMHNMFHINHIRNYYTHKQIKTHNHISFMHRG